MKIQVIIGSVRPNRFAEKPAQWIAEEARKREGLDVELLDLRDYPMPFFAESMAPARMQGKYPNEVVAQWARKITEADGYIMVSPEYNHGYSAVLKNALDHIYPEWNRKPVGFIGYGGVGGARAIEQLRLVAIELEMAPIRPALHIPTDVYSAITSGKPDAYAPLKANTERFLDQLVWWTRALKTAREQGGK
ncbi:NADPH-dependent FMN reductase [Hyalangium versicolor]|uniref:NADPH-dependent FMN reductase n=1 Tax=Hyalangium versicolor TaxID=2861190 RepID=UPI001CCFA0E5|nr:NAD(P)H-dependent oxidoreductase [Hyalangium versicolor]